MKKEIIIKDEFIKLGQALKLAGAVQISGRTFFAFKDCYGRLSLKSDKEEKVQKAIR